MSKNCCCCLFFFFFQGEGFFNFFHVFFCRHGGLKVGDKILAINDRVSKIITTLVIDYHYFFSWHNEMERRLHQAENFLAN